MARAWARAMILGLGHYETANAVSCGLKLGAYHGVLDLGFSVRSGRSLANATTESGVEVNGLFFGGLNRSFCSD